MNSDVKLSNRILAYLLDILLVYVVISLLVSIRFINPYYDEYIEAYEKYSDLLTIEDENVNINDLINSAKDEFYNVNKYGIVYNLTSCMIIFLYFGLFQKFNNGQTLGKKIMKIKVVDNKDNNNPSLLKYLIRILPLQYIYIGGFLPLLLTSLLVFLLKGNAYLYSLTIVTFGFMVINIISFLLIIFRKDKRGLHDLIAGTKVVKE